MGNVCTNKSLANEQLGFPTMPQTVNTPAQSAGARPEVYITQDYNEETHVKGLYEPTATSNNPITLDSMIHNNNTPLLDSSINSSNRTRYIKRYRNEEEKLMDMLAEREAVIQTAIKQGQQLRAKCNRYKDELENLRALSAVDMTDVDWKNKYNDLDRKYHDLKETMHFMEARNKTDRDCMRSQNDAIEKLKTELNRYKVKNRRMLSASLTSLSNNDVRNTKTKVWISRLEVDKRLLQDRVNELTVRNQRGREYLNRIEEEKRQQNMIISDLKSQLLQVKAENELLLKTSSMVPRNNETGSEVSVQVEDSTPIYAQVSKEKKEQMRSLQHNEDRRQDESDNNYKTFESNDNEVAKLNRCGIHKKTPAATMEESELLIDDIYTEVEIGFFQSDEEHESENDKYDKYLYPVCDTSDTKDFNAERLQKVSDKSMDKGDITTTDTFSDASLHININDTDGNLETRF